MRLVTITENGREVWVGPYKAFEKDHFDVLSIAEFCALYQFGMLTIGPRDGCPARLIRLEFVTVH